MLLKCFLVDLFVDLERLDLLLLEEAVREECVLRVLAKSIGLISLEGDLALLIVSVIVFSGFSIEPLSPPYWFLYIIS